MAQKLTKEIILKTLEKNQDKLKEFSVRKIGLFGSYSRDEQKRGSDIDFLVTLDNQTFDNYMDLKFFLERKFRRKVDVVMIGALKPALRHVKKEAIYV